MIAWLGDATSKAYHTGQKTEAAAPTSSDCRRNLIARGFASSEAISMPV
jgi:hypothetical protein